MVDKAVYSLNNHLSYITYYKSISISPVFNAGGSIWALRIPFPMFGRDQAQMYDQLPQNFSSAASSNVHVPTAQASSSSVYSHQSARDFHTFTTEINGFVFTNYYKYSLLTIFLTIWVVRRRYFNLQNREYFLPSGMLDQSASTWIILG